MDTNMMIDIETLGTEKDAVVLSLGLCLFNTKGVQEELYLEFDHVDQLVSGRSVSRDTVEWWLKTDKVELKRLLHSGTASSGSTFLFDTLDAWYEKGMKVWTRGSMDTLILKDMCGGSLPWPFYMERDCRTLDEFRKMEKTNGHNALDDCKNQVEHVRSVMEDWVN